MYRPEFVALQLSILVRSEASRSLDVQEFMDSVPFKAEMQERLAGLIQETLQANNVPFDEIIITLDRPPQRAKPVEAPKSSADKPSKLARLFGKK
jgi:hypothetical protein